MPKKISEKEIFRSKVFTIKEAQFDFDGQIHHYQYLDKRESVMILALDHQENIYFVREYFAAIDAYQLCLPKGLHEDGFTLEESAAKELQEEVHKHPGRLIKLAEVTLSPGYNNQYTHIFLALDLSDSPLAGDEPEQLEIVKVPFKDTRDLIVKGELTEARAIAALYLLEEYLKTNGEIKLNQISLFGHHGVLASEKADGQEFLLDITLQTDLDLSAKSDKLADTINYADVYESVKVAFYEQNFDLLEALAHHITKRLIDQYPIFSASVEIFKPQVPIAGDLHSSSVKITLQR